METMQEKLQDIVASFSAALQEFEQCAIQYIHDSSNEELYHAYIYSKSHMGQLSAQLRQWIQTCKQHIQEMKENKNTRKEKKDNKNTRKENNIINKPDVDAQQGAEQFQEDSETERTLQWNKNCRLVVGILLIGTMIDARVFIAGLFLFMLISWFKSNSVSTFMIIVVGILLLVTGFFYTRTE